MSRAGFFFTLIVLLCGSSGTLEAQLGITGTLTGRAALEQYGGDFSAVTVPHVDSTEQVVAGASEWLFQFGRGFAHSTRRLDFIVGGALRQFTTAGFRQRNYAPREHNFSLRSEYTELLPAGTFSFAAEVDTRGVADLPPMPLYLSPGYGAYSLDLGLARPISGNMNVDARLRFEEKDYAGPSVLPTLDYLDRRAFELQAGGTRLFRGPPGTEDYSTLRLFTAYLHHRYALQGHRRDHAFQVGGRWYLDRFESRGFRFEAIASGVLNRSNSRRVEYDAIRLEATAQQKLGESYLVQLKGIWSAKSYVRPQEFLVPGEEADNAAIFDGEVTRVLGAGVSASLGGSWTRAETNISGDYYRRVRLYFGLLKNLSF